MNTLPIHSFLFNSTEFKVYGTHEEPLFKCSDVLVNLLGYRDSDANNFYAENKNNTRYVSAPPIHRGTLRPLNQYSETQMFFTELGLYRCLFTSRKPFAIDF
jgi:prophage antirepressor-like protein